SHEMVASPNCPQLKVTKEKITENQARDLAQQYVDKNLAGFNVVRPLGYGGGYQTVCYKIDSPATGRYQAFYSVEYSIDAPNSSAETPKPRRCSVRSRRGVQRPLWRSGRPRPRGPSRPRRRARSSRTSEPPNPG